MNTTTIFPTIEVTRLATNLLWQASCQAGLVVLLVWGVCRLFPTRPASARCCFGRLALLKFVLILVTPLPALRLPLRPAPPPTVTARPPDTAPLNSNPSIRITNDTIPPAPHPRTSTP